MTKAALRIAKYAQEVMPITGTPMRDKVENVWPILKLLEPDCENFTAFKNKYCQLERMSFGGRVFDKIVGYQNLTELRERIMSKAIRRTKEEVLDLPEKRFSYLTCELSGEQRKLYRDVEKAVMVELEVVNDANLVIHATHILGRMIRLMQITSDPGVLTGNFGSAKLTVLDELINDLYSEYPDRKVIIWSNWINMINYLERHIQEEHGIGSVAIHGQVRDFEKRLKSFKADKNCKILICNPKIGGEGLNLTVANTNIYFDRNFSLQMWKQSQDRVHRAGQKLNCMNYILYAENTIDELINTTLLQKEKMGCDISGGDFTKLDSIKAFVKFMRGRK
jgi:SNF2 family DNA or RNA helicase